MVKTKVFVGNLSFKTTEAELAQEFSASAKVVSANIITRGPRSLGYGFVELESEQDASAAVAAMNKKEVDGRPINVEIARPRQEGEGEENNGQHEDGSSFQQQRGGRGGRGSRGGFRGRGGRGAPRGALQRGGGVGGAPPRRNFGGRREQSEEDEDTERPRGGFRRRRGGRGGNNINNNVAPRSPKSDNRTESKTSLFVANLPFNFDDDAFGKVLKDAGLTFKQAHVVKKHNGRSKGFGFAEFDHEQDQQKALSSLDKKVVEGRELIVKIALTETGQQQQGQESTTTTSTTTTTTSNNSNTTPAKTEAKEEPKKN
jgi:RNA recognition motif-containing protein